MGEAQRKYGRDERCLQNLDVIPIHIGTKQEQNMKLYNVIGRKILENNCSLLKGKTHYKIN
jgi:hypothetical protein